MDINPADLAAYHMKVALMIRLQESLKLAAIIDSRTGGIDNGEEQKTENREDAR